MEQKFPSRYLAYVLLVASFFGILRLMGFLMPHYVPSEMNYDTATTDHKEISNTHLDAQQDAEFSNTIPSEVQPETSASIPDSTETNSENDYFLSLKNKYQTEVINKLTPGKPRTDVIIRYYNHPPDGNKIYALRELGFYIHERPADPNLKSYESNSIYYGDSIKREDLLIVAYTLIKMGMPIKSISRSIYHDGWKANSIEIGTDENEINSGILSLSELKAITF